MTTETAHWNPRRIGAVAALITRLDPPRRMKALARLLGSVGPLALTVIAGGVFAKYLEHARAAEIPLAIDDALRLTSLQVLDLVRYVAQSDPAVLARLLALLDPA